MQEKVLRYIKENQMIKQDDTVIMGVSGGADSICLLHILIKLQEMLSFKVVVVHVNHNLRGKAAKADEQFVEKVCEQYRIPCKVVTVEVKAKAKERGMTVEEAGRAIRREIFETIVNGQKDFKIALGHHQDDQAETVIHNLARGSALTGICGIHPVRGQYIRPLLCVSRKEIERYLQDNDVMWCDDESNFEDTYTRNKIRHNVLKYLNDEVNTKATKHIADSARRLQEVEEYFLNKTKKAMKKYTVVKNGDICIDEKIASKSRLIQKYVLRECVKELAGSMKDLSEEHIVSMISVFEKEVGKKVEIVSGIEFRRTYEGAVLTGRKQTVEEPPKVEEVVLGLGEFKVGEAIFTCSITVAGDETIAEKRYTKWLDYDKIKGNLVIRSRRPGDVIVTCASGGKKKLKDYFIDAKIPQEKRGAVLLLAMGSEILWIIGDRISEKYKVSADTKQILKICKEGEEMI